MKMQKAYNTQIWDQAINITCIKYVWIIEMLYIFWDS